MSIEIIQSPARHPVSIQGENLVCAGTGRCYRVVNGTPQVFDEMDISPFLRRDYGRFEIAQRATAPDPRWEAIEVAYNRAKAINTDWMFSVPCARRLRVLELGVGAAGLIKRFGSLGHEAWALDFFPWEMEASRDGSYRTISAPMSRLPFKSSTFDLIYFHAALHHALPNAEVDFQWSSPHNMVDCLREVRRILRPEGALFLTGEGLYPEGVTDRQYEQVCQTDGAVYESWYTLTEYEQAFRQAGMFPSVWLAQDSFMVRAHTYSWLGERVPLVTPADEIGEWNYDKLLPRLMPALSTITGEPFANQPPATRESHVPV